MSDILSLEDSESSFSGFDSDSLRSSKKKMKSAVVCRKNTDSNNNKSTKKSSSVDKTSGKTKSKVKDQSKSKKKSGGTPSSSTSTETKENNVLDISKLSEKDLDSLKAALGLIPENENNENYEVFENEHYNMEARPNLHVQLDSDALDNDVQLEYDMHSSNFAEVLFEDSSLSEDSWQMPKLKAPEKGPAIGQNLAQLINTACSMPCDTDNIVSKYKIPENCFALGAPLVNGEIWKVLERKVKAQDRGVADIQNLLSAGLVPVVQLADMLKTSLQNNPKAKSLLADILTIIGQAQYQLSIRRRYFLRPHINKRYANLCNVNTPVSSFLFGDDISKEINNCDAGVSLARDLNRYGRGRGYFPRQRFSQRGGYYGPPDHRYMPYPQRGGQGFRGFRGGFHRGRRAQPTATVTSDQSKN